MALRANSTQLNLRASPVIGPKPSAISYFVAGINQRLRQKKSTRGKLTSVEKHLQRSQRNLRRACFGPSIGACLGEIGSALMRPLAVGLLAAFIVVAEGRSAAWFSGDWPLAGDWQFSAFSSDQSDDDDWNAELVAEVEQLARLAEAPVEEVSDLVLPGQAPEPAVVIQPINAPQNLLNPDQRESMVKFIAGLIAVFYPDIENCGETALHIVELSDEAGMDPLYVASVIAIESRFRTHARSSAGAMGLMQLRPSTAKEVSATSLFHTKPKLTDPWTNIKLGIEYLKRLENRYRGNRYLALTAYNWGFGNLDQARASGKNIPRSVRDYATTILERTVRWQKHFKRASQAADKIQPAPAMAINPETTGDTRGGVA